MPKRMRAISRSTPTGVYPIERRPPGSHAYYDGVYNPEDSLDTLLAEKVHRDVSNEATRREVHVNVAQKMDTGIRVNHALASALGVKVTSGAKSDEPRFLPEMATRSIALMVIGERLDSRECDERRLRLVALRWSESDSIAA